MDYQNIQVFNITYHSDKASFNFFIKITHVYIKTKKSLIILVLLQHMCMKICQSLDSICSFYDSITRFKFYFINPYTSIFLSSGGGIHVISLLLLNLKRLLCSVSVNMLFFVLTNNVYPLLTSYQGL